jgi:pyridinium-3,5-bisthiocarboxylic acid mononucleotide nickel chelatase
MATALPARSHACSADGAPVIAWFHCFAGIAGDMALGALLDAGADAEEVTGLLRRVPVSGWDLQIEPVLRGGIACTRVVVVVRDGDHVERAASHIAAAVRAASLPKRVERRSLDVFAALAEAEGRLHRRDPRDVHLHEAGGHDTLIEVIGTASALEVLDVDEILVSPLAVGTGTIESAHGVLPNPPPAVLRLLEGAPTYGRSVDVELTTPTGAALVSALAGGFGPLPSMTVSASGYGAGSAELDHLPNATQVVVGAPAQLGTGTGQEVSVLEANLDDATGEQLATAIRALLVAGALDAWVTPAVMKKGRPGHVLHVLSNPALAEDLASTMRQATGTFGVRTTKATRWAEARTMDEVAVTGETVRMKVTGERAKPEHDDVERVAAVTGLNAHEVASRAEEAWRRR